MHSLADYRTAARRVLDETRQLEGSWRLEAWRHLMLSLSPELAAAVGELVAMADRDGPLQPVPAPDDGDPAGPGPGAHHSCGDSSVRVASAGPP